MAFADFDFYTSGSSLIVTNDTVAPLVGTGSVKGVASGSGTRTMVGNVSVASSLPLAFTKGKIRGLFKVEAFSGGFNIGLSCMMSAKDTTTTGNLYALFIRSDGGGAAYRPSLQKFASGLDDASPLTLKEGSNNPSSITTNSLFALELEWQYEPTLLHGIHFVGRVGTMTDFSDLATVLDVTDGLSFYTSTAAEGYVARFTTTDTGTFYMDTTRHFSEA